MTVTQNPSLSREALALRVREHDGDHFSTGGLCGRVAELLLSRGASERALFIAAHEHGFTPEVLEAEGFTGEQIAA